MSDFMLIAHAPADGTPRYFDQQMQSLKRMANTILPQIHWQMEFNLGNGKMIELFSATDYDEAIEVSRAAQNDGIRAEVSRFSRQKLVMECGSLRETN